MEKDYLYQHLLCYAYRELPADEALATAQLLEEDNETMELFEEIRKTKVQLPKVQFNPSDTVLHKILQYSTKTALEAQV